jgi:hypothetical protein
MHTIRPHKVESACIRKYTVALGLGRHGDSSFVRGRRKRASECRWPWFRNFGTGEKIDSGAMRSWALCAAAPRVWWCRPRRAESWACPWAGTRPPSGAGRASAPSSKKTIESHVRALMLEIDGTDNQDKDVEDLPYIRYQLPPNYFLGMQTIVYICYTSTY